ILFDFILFIIIGLCVGACEIATYRCGVRDGKSMQGALPPAVIPFFSAKKHVEKAITAEDMLLYNMDNPNNQYSNDEIRAARGRKP
ncbi:MAG: hypothetical protein RR234_10335, partial [Christensenella sp.]